MTYVDAPHCQKGALCRVWVQATETHNEGIARFELNVVNLAKLAKAVLEVAFLRVVWQPANVDFNGEVFRNELVKVWVAHGGDRGWVGRFGVCTRIVALVVGSTLSRTVLVTIAILMDLLRALFGVG